MTEVKGGTGLTTTLPAPILAPTPTSMLPRTIAPAVAAARVAPTLAPTRLRRPRRNDAGLLTHTYALRLLTIVLPALYVAWLSPTRSSFGQAPSFVGLDNFRHVLADQRNIRPNGIVWSDKVARLSIC